MEVKKQTEVTEVKYEIAGSYVHFVKFGHGPKNMVMVSGISLVGFEGRGGSIANQYKIFHDEYSCYYFDRRRFIEEGVGIFDFAKDIYSILKSEGVESADFLGVSQGGMISLAIALEHPEMVRSLVLGSSAPYKTEIAGKTGADWKKHLAAGEVHAFNILFYQRIYSRRFFEKHKRALDRLANIGTADDCVRFIRLLEAVESYDVRSRLHELRCPCFVIGAAMDETLGIDGSECLAEALGCKYYVYPEGSHTAYDEEKDYEKRVKDFLDEVYA